jgi:exonuclease III
LNKVELIDAFRYLYPNKRAYTWWNMRIGGRKRAGETGIGKRLDYFLITK